MNDQRVILTCPACRYAASETMPLDRCVFFYECRGCGTVLKPTPGDCCVFCSYGDKCCPVAHDVVGRPWLRRSEVDQSAAQKVDHLEGGSFYADRLRRWDNARP